MSDSSFCVIGSDDMSGSEGSIAGSLEPSSPQHMCSGPASLMPAASADVDAAESMSREDALPVQHQAPFAGLLGRRMYSAAAVEQSALDQAMDAAVHGFFAGDNAREDERHAEVLRIAAAVGMAMPDLSIRRPARMSGQQGRLVLTDVVRRLTADDAGGSAVSSGSTGGVLAQRRSASGALDSRGSFAEAEMKDLVMAPSASDSELLELERTLDERVCDLEEERDALVDRLLSTNEALQASEQRYHASSASASQVHALLEQLQELLRLAEAERDGAQLLLLRARDRAGGAPGDVGGDGAGPAAPAPPADAAAAAGADRAASITSTGSGVMLHAWDVGDTAAGGGGSVAADAGGQPQRPPPSPPGTPAAHVHDGGGGAITEAQPRESREALGLGGPLMTLLEVCAATSECVDGVVDVVATHRGWRWLAVVWVAVWVAGVAMIAHQEVVLRREVFLLRVRVAHLQRAPGADGDPTGAWLPPPYAPSLDHPLPCGSPVRGRHVEQPPQPPPLFAPPASEDPAPGSNTTTCLGTGVRQPPPAAPAAAGGGSQRAQRRAAAAAAKAVSREAKDTRHWLKQLRRVQKKIAHGRWRAHEGRSPALAAARDALARAEALLQRHADTLAGGHHTNSTAQRVPSPPLSGRADRNLHSGSRARTAAPPPTVPVPPPSPRPVVASPPTALPATDAWRCPGGALACRHTGAAVDAAAPRCAVDAAEAAPATAPAPALIPQSLSRGDAGDNATATLHPAPQAADTAAAGAGDRPGGPAVPWEPSLAPPRGWRGSARVTAPYVRWLDELRALVQAGAERVCDRGLAHAGHLHWYGAMQRALGGLRAQLASVHEAVGAGDAATAHARLGAAAAHVDATLTQVAVGGGSVWDMPLRRHAGAARAALSAVRAAVDAQLAEEAVVEVQAGRAPIPLKPPPPRVGLDVVGARAAAVAEDAHQQLEEVLGGILDVAGTMRPPWTAWCQVMHHPSVHYLRA